MAETEDILRRLRTLESTVTDVRVQVTEVSATLPFLARKAAIGSLPASPTFSNAR
jgi:hypothetical protein